jgi:hypothetical protein
VYGSAISQLLWNSSTNTLGFADHPWVANALKRFGGHPRLKRRRGRPRRPAVEPLTVYALVTALLDSRKAQCLGQAFTLLEDWGWLSSAVTAKRLYRRAKREGRHCALLIKTGPEQDISSSEVEAIREGAQMLKPNETIKRAFDDPALGLVEITIEGKDQVGSTRDFVLLQNVSLVGLDSVLHPSRQGGRR